MVKKLNWCMIAWFLAHQNKRLLLIDKSHQPKNKKGVLIIKSLARESRLSELWEYERHLCRCERSGAFGIKVRQSRIQSEPGPELVPGGFGVHLGEIECRKFGSSVWADCRFIVVVLGHNCYVLMFVLIFCKVTKKYWE